METKKPPQDPRITRIAPLVVGGGVLVILAAVLAFRHGEHLSPAPIPKPKPPEVALSPVALPVRPPPPLSRNDLISGAERATGLYAVGRRPEAKDPWIGRRFDLRIPFGCDGPQNDAGASQAYYEVDIRKKTARLSARPVNWTDVTLVRELPDADDIEAVEGFWVPRPWSPSDACPPRRDTPAMAAPTPPSAPTLGVAAFFRKGGSRVGQRGARTYETVTKLDDDAQALQRTYALRLEGEVVGYADGAAVRCWSESPDHRPLCLYAVRLDRVSMESQDGKTIAEWRD